MNIYGFSSLLFPWTLTQLLNTPHILFQCLLGVPLLEFIIICANNSVLDIHAASSSYSFWMLLLQQSLYINQCPLPHPQNKSHQLLGHFWRFSINSAELFSYKYFIPTSNAYHVPSPHLSLTTRVIKTLQTGLAIKHWQFLVVLVMICDLEFASYIINYAEILIISAIFRLSHPSTHHFSTTLTESYTISEKLS